MDDAQFRQLQLIVKAAVLEATSELTEKVSVINSRLKGGDERMGRIETAVKTSTESTSEMREMFDTAKKGLALMGSLGNALKWIAGVLGPIAAMWAVLHGKPPNDAHH